jgi:hypothetical protein
MISGYIDAFLVACPSSDEGAAAFQTYVDDLLQWSRLRTDTGVTIYASTTAYDVLAATDSYPLWAPLSRNLAAFNLTHVQAKDVVNLVHSLLTKAPVVEDVLGLAEFLCEAGCCRWPWAVGTRDHRFEVHAQHIVVAMCLVERQLANGQSRHLLFTRGCESNSTISLDATVEDADGPNKLAFHWPLAARGTFGACVDASAVWDGTDVAEIFLEGLQRHDSELLLRAVREALRRRGHAEVPWRVNAEFFATVLRLGGGRQVSVVRAIIRACVETVIGENMRATHRLRRGVGAEEPQRVRTRDGAGAWRRDIDHEYHLHYWETESGPELAAAVVHSDLSIPE